MKATAIQDGNAWVVAFRHPLRMEDNGKPGRKTRRGLKTDNSDTANLLVGELNELLSDQEFWRLDSKAKAEKKYDPRVINIFYCEDARYKSDSWDKYFMGFAIHAATRGSCLRKAVGCVIVFDKNVVATGYNGAPSGMPHCKDVGCLVSTTTYPQGYTTDHCIRSVHAEANALLQAAKHGHRTAGSILYTTSSPCRACMMLIISAGVAGIVYAAPYRLDLSADLAKFVKLTQME